jgi:hypothetical protein
MNPPIAPIPVPPELPKPVVPSQPMSVKKLVLFIVVGLLFVGGITLAAWEEGRVGLFSSFGMKGYKRREADGLMVASKGKKPDFKEAFRLYQIDAEKGDGESLRKIGEMYRDGKGVPQSYDKARENWIKAAAPGDIGTLLWLADKYRTGDGRALQVSHPEAIRLLRRAASQGDDAAQAKLARQLLTYVGEYQMKLDFDEVLSARQREELLSLPKIAELLKDNADGKIEKMTSGQLNEKVAAAIAELSEAIREKFNWEAYFWLSLSAASGDDADLRATREGVGAKLKDKTIERVQGLVGKWSQSDAPGNAESPFTLDEGPVLDAPAVNKQTLSALLQQIAAKANTLPEAQPEPAKPAPAKPAGSASAPKPAPAPAPAPTAPQKPASLSAALAAMPVQSVDPEKTKKYVQAMYEAQLGMAIRRNVLFRGKHNLNGEYLNFSIVAKSYNAVIAELKICEAKLKDLRADSKLVHPDVLAYSDRLSQLLAGRVVYVAGLQQAATNALKDSSQAQIFNQKFADFDAWGSRELVGLNATEAVMTKRLGDELSIAVPDRNQLYTETQRAHERSVLDQLKTKSASDIYAMIVDGGWKYGDWTFEFGELRESRVGRPVASEGEVRVPYELSAVDRNGNSRVFSLNLYFTVTSKGTLRLIGI